MSLRSAGIKILMLSLLFACDSQPTLKAEPKTGEDRGEGAGSEDKQPAEQRQLPSFSGSKFEAPGRVVAIGDLHGDLHATRSVLRLAGAMDASGKWIGGDLVVVQTGDQLDRGDQEQQILDLLDELQTQAAAAGGALHVLNGNHETMNARGDFRYVTAGGFRDFEGSDARPLPAGVLDELPSHTHARAAAFLPGGRYAKQMAEHPVIAVVGDTVFAHGGVLYKHLIYGIDRLNSEVRSWMLGAAAEPRAILTPEAPVWSRLYSEGVPGRAACRELKRVLKALDAKRMVVGHTVQRNGVTSGCGGKIWRIDVGMSAHYRGSRVEALQLEAGKVLVLREKKSRFESTPANVSTKQMADPAVGSKADD